jgi:GDP-mannose 6-dehydrogenase
MTYRAKRVDLRLPLLESALSSNREHLHRALEAVLDSPGRRLGIIGLAFKEQTDDLRESPVVSLVEALVGKGRLIRVFDPQIQFDTIYGSNRDYALLQIPHIRAVLDESIEKTIAWADELIVAQKLPTAYAARIAASGLPVIDLVSPSLEYLQETSLEQGRALVA